MKDNTIIIALLSLIVGLFLGYMISPGVDISPENMSEIHNETKEEHNENEEYANGMMQHIMDEMEHSMVNVEGEAYEKAFLEMMIVHHIGAIKMAERLLEETDRPELVNMANNIINVQTTEVETMNQWLNDWFNS